MDVLRTLVHVRILDGEVKPATLEESVVENRWAPTVQYSGGRWYQLVQEFDNLSAKASTG